MGSIGKVSKSGELDADCPVEMPGTGLSAEDRDKDLFKLEKDKQELIDEIGLAMSRMERKNHPKPREQDTLEAMEERIMLFERLEHKEEYFFTLETYIMRLVKEGDVERLGQIISKYDSQYKVHKKLKLENAAFDEYFLGTKKSIILEEFIKPKIELNPEVYKLVFKKK